MGERACYTGICDACGKTPPCLQWMYPEVQPPQRKAGPAAQHPARSQHRCSGHQEASKHF